MTTISRREGEEEEQTPKKTKTIQQQSQQQGVDRISQLSDDILHPILSLLTFEEACTTSVLSKRWRALFQSIPRLELYRWYDIDMEFWLESVRRMLESRRAPVRICTILADFFSEYSEDFDNIICLLCNNGIQELTVEHDIEGDWTPYTVPSSLFFCWTLTRLEISKCILKVPVKFCLLRRLNALKIVECMVEDDDLRRLILGCPAVQRLTVENCYRLRNLVVDAPKLAVLEVTTHRPLGVSIVNAPRLESVTVRLWYDHSGMYFHGEEAEAAFDLDDVTGTEGNLVDESEGIRLVRLLESIGDTQSLSLEYRNSHGKILTEGVVLPVTLRSLLPKLKKITLKMQLGSTFSLSIVSCLLNSCPNLDDLVIVDAYWYLQNKYPYAEASVLGYWDQQMPSDCMRNMLSSVTLYVGVEHCWKYLIKLVKFLLNNACVLKNLVIDFYHKNEDLSKRVEDLHMEMRLLSPAFPDAVVRFKAGRSWLVYRPARITFGCYSD